MVSGVSGDGGTASEAAGFSTETAGAVFREACAKAGFDPAGGRLLRLGSNAVYRLADRPVIVRIASDPAALAEMERAVRVARWLEEERFPANRVLAGVGQPVVAGGRVVTFWDSVQDEEEFATLPELADLLEILARLLTARLTAEMAAQRVAGTR